MRFFTVQVGFLRTNCYILYDERTCEAVIIDPGQEAEKIAKKIEENGLKPIKILLTHGHFDHILAVPELKERYDIPVFCGENEVELLGEPEMNHSFQMNRALSLKPDRTLADGEEFEALGRKFRVISTPGHTIGSICYYVPEQEVLFAGDTLFRETYGRTDFPTGDFKMLRESIIGKLFLLPDATAVFPGHMEDTTIGHERRTNPIFAGWE